MVRLKTSFKHRFIPCAASWTQRLAPLHVRLENMKPHTKITHGDFNPTNIILGDDGKTYVVDWAHAAIGNASADAATTYLQFAIHDQKTADLYMKLFCRRNDIAIQYVKRWLPIVAAAQ